MLNAFVSRKDLDSEMSVVRNEFEIGENNPGMILEERVASTAYLWHNYGKSTIGARSDIENVPIDRLDAFYKTWYRPENATLIVAGKIDPEWTLAKIDEKFSPLANPDSPMPEVYTKEPAQDGGRSVTLRRVGDTQVTAAAYHIPSGSHPEFASLVVLERILADTPSGRLHESLVETKMAASVRGDAYRFHDAGLFYVSAEVAKDKSLEDAHLEITRVLEGLTDAPPTMEEVDRARNALLRRWETSSRNTRRTATGMTEWVALGDWRLAFWYRDRLKEVTPESVLAAATTYLHASNRTDGFYIPTDEPMRVEIPANPNLAEMLDGYTGGEAMAMGEEFDATPETIEARLVRTNLAAGTKLWMLPKKTRGATVSVNMNLHFGDEETLRGMAMVGRLTGRMLSRGAGELTRQEIQDQIDQMQVRVTVRAGAENATASIEATRETLPQALMLASQMLRHPTFPESEFELLREEMALDLDESKTSPFNRAFTMLSRHANPLPAEHVRYSSTPEEQLASMTAVSRDDLVAFHEKFYGATYAEIAVVGDFDPTEVQELLAEELGDWQSPSVHKPITIEFSEQPAVLQVSNIPDKESAVLAIGKTMAMNDESPDYPALALGDFMTGGGFLNSRLATRIRQKEGISYSVGSRLNVSSLGNNSWWGGMAMYAPQNDDRLILAFHEEMEKIYADGFTAEEIAEAKSGWMQQRSVSRSADRELVGQLTRRAYLGRDMSWDTAFEAAVSTLTPAQIHAAFQRHMDPSKLSIIRAGSLLEDSGDGNAAGASD
jgi:zinc protease